MSVEPWPIGASRDEHLLKVTCVNAFRNHARDVDNPWWSGVSDRRAKLGLFPLLVAVRRFQPDLRALSDILGCDGDDRLKRSVRTMLVEMYGLARYRES